MRIKNPAFMLFITLVVMQVLNKLGLVNAVNALPIQPRKLRAITSRPTAATIDFTDQQVLNACDNVNTLRRNVAATGKGASNLIKLIVNNNLTKTIKEFVASPYNGSLTYTPLHGKPLTYADWGYSEDDNVTPPANVDHYTNFHIMNHNPKFLEIAKKYNVYNLVTQNAMVIGHDTWNEHVKDGALKILKLRIEQSPCINITKCQKNSTPFDHYQGCIVTNVKNLPKQCAWSFWYTPLLELDRAKIFSWVNLNVPGRFVGELKQSQAWLFVMVLNGHEPTVNNIPYKVGTACSQCPLEFPKCQNSLCVSDTSLAPTRKPTPLVFTSQPLSQMPSQTPSQKPTIAPSGQSPSRKATKYPTKKKLLLV